MDEIEHQLVNSTAGFNSLDWIILGVVALSMLIGIVRGFGREALSLLGWVCAFVAANLLAKPLADSLGNFSDSATLRYISGWALVFIGVLAIFTVVGSILAKQLRQPGFNLGNRLLGGAFGVVRGLVVMMVVTLVFKAMLPDSEEDWMNDAELMPAIDTLADWLSENFDDLKESKPVEEMGESFESGDML